MISKIDLLSPPYSSTMIFDIVVPSIDLQFGGHSENSEVKSNIKIRICHLSTRSSNLYNDLCPELEMCWKTQSTTLVDKAFTPCLLHFQISCIEIQLLRAWRQKNDPNFYSIHPSSFIALATLIKPARFAPSSRVPPLPAASSINR